MYGCKKAIGNKTAVPMKKYSPFRDCPQLKCPKKIAPESAIVFFELAKLNQTIVEEIEVAADDATLTSIYGRMVKSSFISTKVDPAQIKAGEKDFEALSLDEKNVL